MGTGAVDFKGGGARWWINSAGGVVVYSVDVHCVVRARGGCVRGLRVHWTVWLGEVGMWVPV